MQLNIEPISTFSTTDIESYAFSCGLELKQSTTGGIYLRLEAFPIGSSKSVGYLTAFLRPIGLLHLDTIQVMNRRQNLGYNRENWAIDGPGISFIMGSWAINWAYSKGFRTAQLLAVKDSEKMHNVLTRLYQSFGFRIVRDVGDDPASIPDRLVWGAVGTLMELDLNNFYKEWTPKFTTLAAVKGLTKLHASGNGAHT